MDGGLTSLISFDREAGDDDFVLERLTGELANDLRSIGDVAYQPIESEPGSKGLAEVAAATVSVLTGADPAHVEAVIQILIGFASRSAGRRAHMPAHCFRRILLG